MENKSWIIQNQEEMDKAMSKQFHDIWDDLWDRYFKHLNKIFNINKTMGRDKIDPTKEEIIVNWASKNNPFTWQDLMDKHSVSEMYAKSFCNRVKNGHIKLEKIEEENKLNLE